MFRSTTVANFKLFYNLYNLKVTILLKYHEARSKRFKNQYRTEFKQKFLVQFFHWLLIILLYKNHPPPSPIFAKIRCRINVEFLSEPDYLSIVLQNSIAEANLLNRKTNKEIHKRNMFCALCWFSLHTFLNFSWYWEQR